MLWTEALERGPRVALDVIGNVRATEGAIAALADRGRPITATDIEDLQHVIEPSLQRGLREEQNWVGGTGWSRFRADFVPPPESEVPRLVADLAAFITERSGNPVVRAAIAHAQFETIHPFIDGNGRTGRALIHTVLRRSDALRNVLIPISTVFAGDTDTDIAGLTAFRMDPPQIDESVIGCARATELAAGNAARLADDVAALGERTLADLIAYGRTHALTPAIPRRDAVILRILSALATEPVLTIEGAARRHGVSTTAAHRALTELADAGILGRTKDQRGRLICWTADRHLALVDLTERSNRGGAGDTTGRAPRAGPPLPEVDLVGELRGGGGVDLA